MGAHPFFPTPRAEELTVYSRIQNDAAMIVHRERIADAIARREQDGGRRRGRGVRIVIGRLAGLVS